MTTLEVDTWQVNRDLTGGALPGQVRAASGFAKASGSLEFRQGDGATPWRLGPVLPGGACSIDATADLGVVAASPVARMTIDSISSPSALSQSRSADLIEAVPDAPIALPATLAQRVTWGAPYMLDASWVIDECARAMGRFQTPPPVASAILAIPAAGSVDADVGSLTTVNNAGSWSTTTDGRTFMSTVGSSQQYTYTPTIPIAVGASVFITVTVVSYAAFDDSLSLWLQDSSGVLSSGHSLALYYNGGNLNGNMSGTDGSLVSGDVSAGHDTWWRTQFQVEYTSATSMRIRARAGAGAAWSSWVTVTNPMMALTGPLATIRIGGAFTGLQVHSADDTSAWTAPTAFIAASGSPVVTSLATSSSSSWSLAQDVAAKTLGALWIDESGNLRYAAKETLRGAGGSLGTIVAKTSVADLPWSISSADVADRVAVTYQPPDLQTSTTGSITVWQATDSYAIGAGRTITVDADLDGAVDSLASWLPITDTTTAPIGQRSRWAAASSRDGGGAAPPSTALAITAALINPSKVRLTIRNTTAGTLYTVDGNGNPTLILRANYYASAGGQVTIWQGAPEASAQAPLTVDLGSTVQDPDVARAMLSWLWSMTTTPLPVLDAVSVWPDLSIRLGDVRVLRDPDYTGVASKVLVTGVDLSGEPGKLTQTLRLALLAILDADLTRLYAALGLTTEGAVTAYLTAQLGAGATEADVTKFLNAKAVP